MAAYDAATVCKGARGPEGEAGLPGRPGLPGPKETSCISDTWFSLRCRERGWGNDHPNNLMRVSHAKAAILVIFLCLEISI